MGKDIQSLVVVDNDPRASAESVVREYSQLHPETRYVTSQTNTGPAGGWAQAMDLLLPNMTDDDWILILDDDDPLLDARIPVLLLQVAQDCAFQPVGAVGLTGKTYGRLMFGEGSHQSIVGGCRRVDSVDEGNGAIFLAGAIRNAGGFRGELFFGFEGLDLCLRLKNSGYSVVEAVDVFAMYRDPNRYLLKRGIVPRKYQLGPVDWKRYYSLRNYIVILRENRSEPIAAFHVVVRGFGKPLLYLLQRPRLALTHLRYNFNAMIDAYRGVLGKRPGLPD